MSLSLLTIFVKWTILHLLRCECQCVIKTGSLQYCSRKYSNSDVHSLWGISPKKALMVILCYGIGDSHSVYVYVYFKQPQLLVLGN